MTRPEIEAAFKRPDKSLKNVIVLKRDSGEIFAFVYDDESGMAVMETFGRFANDPELDFTWDDALILGEKVQTLKKAKEQP